MNKYLKKAISFLAGFTFMFTAAACAPKTVTPPDPETPSEPEILEIPEMSDYDFTLGGISAADSFGRTSYASFNKQEYKRDVGLFYFLWLGAHGNHVYDISKLLEEDPDSLWNAQGTENSPVGQYHFWGEPLYGYYRSNDPWVLTRHVELFTMSGIDFLAFDVTNAVTYDNVVKAMLEVLDRYQKQGWNVPKITFMTNTNSKNVVNSLYNTYYKEGAPCYYPDLWYSPNGKPMLCANPRNFPSDTEIGQFFDLRKTDWPNAPLHDEEDFPWMDWRYPQTNFSGIMSVSVAQHTASRMSSQEANWGRGYDQTRFVNDSSKVDEGLNFRQQWDTVHSAVKTDPNSLHTVFLTGWNEWIAIKFAQPDVYFVDTFNKEYSRDIEMMKGGYGDNFYLQMVQNVKQFKYRTDVDYFYRTGAAGDWSKAYTYLDFNGDALERNFRGYESGVTYKDTTNRNDIVKTEIMQDAERYYFRVTTAEPISEYTQGDANWMNIWLSVQADGGYDYVVNREYGKISKKSGSGYQTVGDASVSVEGNQMTVAIAKSALGTPSAIRVRVSDNVDSSDPMNFYIQGDSAPIGALGYTFGNFERGVK